MPGAPAQPLPWNQDPRLHRLLAVMASLLAHPGLDPDALGAEVATRCGRTWSPATLRRDLRLLKDWGLIGDSPQRRGYRLAGFHLSLHEAQACWEAVSFLADHLHWPPALALRDALAQLAPQLQQPGVLHLEAPPNSPPVNQALWQALATGIRQGATLSLSPNQAEAPWEGPVIPLGVAWQIQGPWLWVEHATNPAPQPRYARLPLAQVRAALPTKRPHRGRKVQQLALQEALAKASEAKQEEA